MLSCDRGKEPAAAVMQRADAPARRIVSLAPSVTETLFALGAGDRVVGVTRFCDYPPQAATLAKVGGLTDVDVEMVLSLEPDLVLGVQSRTAEPLRRTLSKAGIRAEFLDVETLAEVQSSFRRVGELVGKQQSAEQMAAELEKRRTPPVEDAPRVLVLFGRDPWIGAGPGTFADEMIRAAGGRNALADFDAQYPSLDAERMTTVKPDLVIDASFGDEASEVPGAPRTVKLDPPLIRPGPRLGEGIDVFRAAILEARPR